MLNCYRVKAGCKAQRSVLVRFQTTISHVWKQATLNSGYVIRAPGGLLDLSSATRGQLQHDIVLAAQPRTPDHFTVRTTNSTCPLLTLAPSPALQYHPVHDICAIAPPSAPQAPACDRHAASRDKPTP
jgi:hypothetical protein